MAAISNKSNYSKETFNCEKANIRGHSGFITNCEFYSENIVISSIFIYLYYTFSVRGLDYKNIWCDKNTKSKASKQEEE